MTMSALIYLPLLLMSARLDTEVCASGPDTDALLTEVREWVTRQPVDSAFGVIPLRREDIVAETSEPVCRGLAEAYAKLPGEVFTPESLNVVRIGEGHFAMFDPNVMAGAARSVMIFDAKYVLRESRAINLLPRRP